MASGVKTELLEFLHRNSHYVCSREGADMAVLPLEQLCVLLSHLLHVHFKRVHLQCSC